MEFELTMREISDAYDTGYNVQVAQDAWKKVVRWEDARCTDVNHTFCYKGQHRRRRNCSFCRAMLREAL